MLEARLSEAGLLKRIVDALKDLVTDASFEFTDEGLRMQAMDSSHVSLCVLSLDRDSFESYRCDRATPLGLSLLSLSKVLKCAKDDDTLTLKAGETKDILTLMFENKAQDKIMDFNIKLMEIDEETLGIPEQQYASSVTMESGEFAKIIRDLSVLGDTCSIACNKEGVKFSIDGEIGSANISVRRSDPNASYTTSIDDEDNAGSNPRYRGTEVTINEPVELSFAIRYLKYFTQATPLSERVNFSMATDVPLLIEFPIRGKTDKPVAAAKGKKSAKNKDMEVDEDEEAQTNVKSEKNTGGSISSDGRARGSLRYYLAPKIDDEGVTQ